MEIMAIVIVVFKRHHWFNIDMSDLSQDEIITRGCRVDAQMLNKHNQFLRDKLSEADANHRS